MGGHTYEALYYPFVHFRDEAWVKGMSLFWDGLARIVPGDDYPIRDGESVRGLHDAGVVRDIHPLEARLDAGYIFERILRDHHDEIVARYAVSLKDTWPEDPVTAARARRGDRRLAYLHDDKMHWPLVSTLEEYGLAERGRVDNFGWWGMHPRIVDTYMVILADVIAAQEAACPLTDHITSHRVVATGGAIDRDRLVAGLLDTAPRGTPTTGAEVESVLVAVAFDSLLPNFAHVPVDIVLKVRSETVEARSRFQEGVAELVHPELFAGASRGAVEREMRRVYEARVVPALKEMERSSRRSNVAMLKHSLSVKTQLTGAAAAATEPLTHAPGAWVIGALAMAFGLHDIVSATRAERAKARADQPVVSYLGTLRKRIKATDLATQSVR